MKHSVRESGQWQHTLTVEVPWIVHKLHLNFGLHVEHHLFPSMSSHHAPQVRDALKKLYPDRYQSMRFTRAMWLLMTTPRVYRTPTMLHDPRSGLEAPALVPTEREAAAAEPAASAAA